MLLTPNRVAMGVNIFRNTGFFVTLVMVCVITVLMPQTGRADRVRVTFLVILFDFIFVFNVIVRLFKRQLVKVPYTAFNSETRQ